VTLGQLLKDRRNELGKSIEQISTATRIHVRVLKALEEDQYAQLPARTFTRGFIITYCKALQLDADDIMKSYHDFLESKFSERPEKDQGHHGYAFETSENEQKNKGLIIVASIAAFFAILTLLFFKPQNHKHREKHKELIAEEVEMAAAEAQLKAASDAALQGTASPTANSTATPAVAAGTATPAQAIIATAVPASSPVTTILSTPAPETIALASPTPSPADAMNKGDLIPVEAVGVKVNFQALEDVIIRYRSDDRPLSGLNLRKDKQLVIKATGEILFETSNPEKLKVKISYKNNPGTSYEPLKEGRLKLKSDGTRTSLSAGAN
jgi:cytoskeletal protein RodZ